MREWDTVAAFFDPIPLSLLGERLGEGVIGTLFFFCHHICMIPLIGYTDKLSGRPGDTFAVKVSSTSDSPYSAELVHVISGDPNPDGPGMNLIPVPSDIDGTYLSREQKTRLGSHMEASLLAELPDSFRLDATVFPTTPDKGAQGVITIHTFENHDDAIILGIGPEGVFCQIGSAVISTGKALPPFTWASIWADIDLASGVITVGQSIAKLDQFVERTMDQVQTDRSAGTYILIAAINPNDPATHFNGKIEHPRISVDDDVVAAWDFSKNMTSFQIEGDDPLADTGDLINGPMRAVTGSNWDASEHNWNRAPEQYGAIHFHDDDIADCNWDTDFTFRVPDDLPSGAYAIRLTSGDDWDLLPIFICPPKGEKTADVCFLISTFTYVIYANQARADFGQHWRDRAADWDAFPHNPADHPEFGLSTYNDHSDGSGIAHTTWHRPIMNLRPGYHPFADDKCGSGLRHFPADTHILAWLNAKDIPFDIVTDWELHHEGPELLAPYKTVLTTSHPEYHTLETLDGVQGYRDGGGNLIYLGGNGFYWRVALHPEKDGLIEVRRAEGGLRAWASEPGEYYSGFTGEYSGLWRRNGRPPNALTGIGYTCQGDFEGTYYRRTSASTSSQVAWMFNGIDDEIIGDFGLCGGGAAGYELDRVEPRLGTPPNAVVVAKSENHPESFVLPPEEWLTHVKTWAVGTPEELVRADMTYFDVPGGGQVFSTGSITFSGSLPCNNFNNNISKLLENVVRHFTS